MITQANWLDIGNLVVNEIIGDPFLALGIGIVLIVFFGVKNTLDNKAILSLLFIWCSGMIGYYFSSSLLSILALIIGFVAYGVWSKYFNR